MLLPLVVFGTRFVFLGLLLFLLCLLNLCLRCCILFARPILVFVFRYKNLRLFFLLRILKSIFCQCSRLFRSLLNFLLLLLSRMVGLHILCLVARLVSILCLTRCLQCPPPQFLRLYFLSCTLIVPALLKPRLLLVHIFFSFYHVFFITIFCVVIS